MCFAATPPDEQELGIPGILIRSALIKDNYKIMSMKAYYDKIIFLDIDGVLNSDNSIKNSSHLKQFADMPSASMVGNLNYIIEETEAKICVSSSWRYIFKLMPLQYLLYLCGVKPHDVIVGVTPVTKLSGNRGMDIRAWLDCNSTKRFVILDDNDDVGNLIYFLVQTDHTYGLTKKDADKAIAVLRGYKT